MYEQEKRAVLDAALTITRYRLVSLCGGNVSLRLADGSILVTPSGMIYEDMTPADIVRVDQCGAILEGQCRPSSDLPALLYVLAHMPWVNGLVHTHQPYATAVGFVTDVLPACLVTQIDANRGDVRVAPFSPSGEAEMGKLTVQYAGDAWATILRSHGVMAFGPTLKDALFSAVYLEEAAQTYLAARAVVSHIPPLDEEMVVKEAESWLHYGQIN